MNLSIYISEAVNIICLDGQSFTGRVKEVNIEEAYLIIRCPVEGTNKIYAKDIKEIYVFGEYDPPLPERTPTSIIFLGEYEELAPGMGFPNMRDFLSPEPYERQDIIVDYLNNGHVHMVTATTFSDVFTGERVSRELVYMDDGEYSWSSKLPYYVHKYNLRLPADFEAHVLSKEPFR